MNNEILGEMLAQNRLTCSFALNGVSEENSGWRANESAASVGFIYRHIGETMNMFGHFFGVATDVQNTTMDREDSGEPIDLAESTRLIEAGYVMLERLVGETPDEAWLETVDTPFFGAVSRARLFSHVLFHTAHHAGQISLTLARHKSD